MGKSPNVGTTCDSRSIHAPTPVCRPALRDLNGGTSSSNARAAKRESSPSPSTAQRLFSARRKREIVKAKKKEVNENGETPLHVASRRGQVDKIQELLKN